MNGEVAQLKQFQYFNSFSRNERCLNAVTMSFTTSGNISREFNWESKAYRSGIGWGYEQWSNSLWGSPTLLYNKYSTDSAEIVRMLIPRNCSFGNWIKVRIVHKEIEPIEIQLFQLEYRNASKVSTK